MAAEAAEKGDAAMEVEGGSSQPSPPPAVTSGSRAAFLGSIRPKLRLLWSGPGPSTVVKQMGQYLLASVGATLYVYKLNASTLEMEQCSFFISKFIITSVSILKDYIVIGDG